MIKKLMTFMSEVKAELKKITWPSKDELVGSTIIVCLLVVVFSILLGSMDASFGLVIKKIIS